HRVVQLLPRARDAFLLRLSATLPRRPGLALFPYTTLFRSRELVHHRVDRVLELEDLAFHVHRDLAREVSPRHGRRHVGDVPHLSREDDSPRLHSLAYVVRRPRHANHIRLAAEPPLGTDLAR